VLDYIKGEISEINPANIVVEANGIGYFINISLNTYSKISEQKNVKIYIHEVIREDTYDLYGFYSKEERDIYRKLISVSGVGPSTARVMLSSLDVNEIYNAIASGDVNTIKSVKGIGLKTAQRVIVDLKDKIKDVEENIEIFNLQDNTIKEESLSALIMLGFNKKQAEKAVDKILKTNKDFNVEQVIKASLKLL